MKKYLKDLEAELKKLNISEEEIAEILEDHKEMLREATEEGISDDEIALKFGDPEKLAKALYEDALGDKMSKKVEPVFGTESLEGYELVNSFPTLEELKTVNISLISEDVMYFPYEGESIEVYVRGKFREEDYTISYAKGMFNLLKSRGKVSFNIFSKKAPDFGVRVPASSLDEFKLSLISGDGELEGVTSNVIELKTVSGDLHTTNLTTEGNLVVSVVSGDVKLNGIIAKGLEMSMVSGDLVIDQGKFDEKIHIGAVSGDTNANNVKVPEIEFHTVSGDFQGDEVYCDTVTFKSVSGDFCIENNNKDHNIEVISKKSLSGKVTIK